MRNLIRIGLCLYFLILQREAFSQLQIGLTGGINSNHISYKNTYRESTFDTRGVFSSQFGILVSQSLKGNIDLVINPSLIRKGFKSVREVKEVTFFQKTLNSYLALPILVQWNRKFGFLWISPQFGMYYNRLIGRRISGMEPNIFDSFFNVDDGGNLTESLRVAHYDEKVSLTKLDERNEFGWIAGLNFRANLNRRIQAFANFQIWSGMTNLYTSERPIVKTRTLIGNIGILHTLKFK